MRAVEGNTAVPPGTYRPTEEILLATRLHLTPLKIKNQNKSD